MRDFVARAGGAISRRLLAAALLIDATIVRAVLLPAVMKLLGEWNWYVPRRLEWLPHVDFEPDDADAVAIDVGTRRRRSRSSSLSGTGW